MRKITITAVAIAGLAACTAGQTITTTSSRTIDDSFFGSALEWSNGVEIPYRFGVFEEDGFFVVCAAAQNIRRGEDQKILNAMKVSADEQVLVYNIRWAPRYPGTGDITGREANCRKTEVPFDPSARVSMELTQTSFRREGFIN